MHGPMNIIFKCHELLLELLSVLFVYLSIQLMFLLLKLRHIRSRDRVAQQRNISSQGVTCIY